MITEETARLPAEFPSSSFTALTESLTPGVAPLHGICFFKNLKKASTIFAGVLSWHFSNSVLKHFRSLSKSLEKNISLGSFPVKVTHLHSLSVNKKTGRVFNSISVGILEPKVWLAHRCNSSFRDSRHSTPPSATNTAKIFFRSGRIMI